MPIEIVCPGCHRRLRVHEENAGQRARCPTCDNIVDVPTGAGPPQTERFEGWCVQSEDSHHYGPVAKSDLDVWVAEGRVTANCQLRKEGSDRWQAASDLYPQLAGKAGRLAESSLGHPFAGAPAAAGYPGVGPGTAGGRVGQYSDKSKIAAGLLGIFLGPIGVHRFYLGFVGLGILQLVLFFITCGVSSWWGFIEGILILAGSIDRDADGLLLRD